MCGIFGAIGTPDNRPDPAVIRALALANRTRGNQSLGFFDSRGEIYKEGSDPSDVLANDKCTAYLDASCNNSWFVVGHTRFATRGAVSDANSHPFKYGDCIGAHNGCVDAPNEYAVDSEYLVDLISQHGNDYAKAFEDVWGYWTFSWFNKQSDELYLTMHDNTCGLVEHNGVYYFSSDADHIAIAVGRRDTVVLDNGNTCYWNSAGFQDWLADFSPANRYGYRQYRKDSRTSGKTNGYTVYDSYGNGGGGGGTGYLGYQRDSSTAWDTDGGNVNLHDEEGVIKDFDDELCAVWADYVNQYDPA